MRAGFRVLACGAGSPDSLEWLAATLHFLARGSVDILGVFVHNWAKLQNVGYLGSLVMLCDNIV